MAKMTRIAKNALEPRLSCFQGKVNIYLKGLNEVKAEIFAFPLIYLTRVT